MIFFILPLGSYFLSFLKRAAQFLSPPLCRPKGNPSALGSQIPDLNHQSQGE